MVETSADVARKNAIKDNQRFIDEHNVQLVRILPAGGRGKGRRRG